MNLQFMHSASVCTPYPTGCHGGRRDSYQYQNEMFQGRTTGIITEHISIQFILFVANPCAAQESSLRLPFPAAPPAPPSMRSRVGLLRRSPPLRRQPRPLPPPVPQAHPDLEAGGDRVRRTDPLPFARGDDFLRVRERRRRRCRSPATAAGDGAEEDGGDQRERSEPGTGRAAGRGNHAGRGRERCAALRDSPPRPRSGPTAAHRTFAHRAPDIGVGAVETEGGSRSRSATAP